MSNFTRVAWHPREKVARAAAEHSLTIDVALDAIGVALEVANALAKHEIAKERAANAIRAELGETVDE